MSSAPDIFAELGIDLENKDSAEPMSAVSGAEVSTGVDNSVDAAELESPPAFTMTRIVFISLLEQVMAVIPTRDPWPPLKNVLIVATEDKLTLTGSDSTSSVESSTSAVQVQQAGRVMVGAETFAKVCRRADGPDITVVCEGSKLHVSSGAYLASLRVAPVQDYPALPELGDLEWVKLDRAKFVQAIDGTRFAASKDPNKDHINQADVSAGEMMTTDELCSARVREAFPSDFSCQIPATGIDLMQKALERNDADEFRISGTSTHVVAEIGPSSTPDRLILARLARPFPSSETRKTFQQPLAENRDELVINADSLVEILRRAAPTVDEETSAVALRVGVPGQDCVTVATRNRYDEVSSEVLENCRFRVAGSEKVAEARTVIVHLGALSKAVKAAVAASPLPDDAEGAGTVVLLLGQPRSKAKPAAVVIQDPSRKVQIVLSQVRSDWID